VGTGSDVAGSVVAAGGGDTTAAPGVLPASSRRLHAVAAVTAISINRTVRFIVLS
jgi:hypothetical protein